MADAYEVQHSVSRAEAATVLHGLADGVAGGTVRVGSGDEEQTVEVPAELDLEVEFEAEDGILSLEVELEWPEDASVEEGAAEDEEAAQEAQEGTPEAHDAAPEARDDTASVGEGASEASDSVEPEDIVAPSSDVAAQQVSLGRFELFEDRVGEWRWRLVHRNGNVIATSGEGYTRKHNARKGLRSVMRNAQGAEVTEPPNE